MMAQAYAAHPQLRGLPPEEGRAIVEQVRAPLAHGGPIMAHTSEHRIETPHGSVGVRLYSPDVSEPPPVLIYMHGGGWVFFSTNTHDRLMREYAARAGCAVLGVEYSRAPEAKFPVALDETAAVARWAAREGGALGLRDDAIALGGDSAGANLALAASLALRDAGEARIVRGLLLNYGAFDDVYEHDAAQFDGPNFMLTRAEMDWFWAQYRPPAARSHPHVRPLIAELDGAPPTHLTIAACDVLAEQNHRMAARLKAAGVEVSTQIYDGATHSFLEAVSISSLAARAIADGAAWLRAVFARSVAHARERATATELKIITENTSRGLGDDQGDGVSIRPSLWRGDHRRVGRAARFCAAGRRPRGDGRRHYRHGPAP
ncbi:MAG TPA: alpha/beta hydrolase [Terricaulis sp.]|nr:alpha/beta hydrolase [Terricaulis sp.]